MFLCWFPVFFSVSHNSCLRLVKLTLLKRWTKLRCFNCLYEQRCQEVRNLTMRQEKLHASFNITAFKNVCTVYINFFCYASTVFCFRNNKKCMRLPNKTKIVSLRFIILRCFVFPRFSDALDIFLLVYSNYSKSFDGFIVYLNYEYFRLIIIY